VRGVRRDDGRVAVAEALGKLAAAALVRGKGQLRRRADGETLEVHADASGGRDFSLSLGLSIVGHVVRLAQLRVGTTDSTEPHGTNFFRGIP
jgi:hypothetical protein